MNSKKGIIVLLATTFLCLMVGPMLGQNTPMSKAAKHISQNLAHPGAIAIDSNYFVDCGEIANVDYREFLYWTTRVFGAEKTAWYYPDTTVWLREDRMAKLSNWYFRGPYYHYRPVVGVSFEQAQAYMKWRADRVFENCLIQEGILEITPNQDSVHYFSIENYFSGKINGVQTDYSIPHPVYSLPSLEEWETICLRAREINSKNYKKCCRKRFVDCVDGDSLEIVSSANMYYKDGKWQPEIGLNNVWWSSKNVFFNLQGNVSEFSSTPGISLGGSWKNTPEEIRASDTFMYEGPNAWTGFRCVLHWEYHKKPD